MIFALVGAHVYVCVHTYIHTYMCFLPCYCHVFIFRLDRDLKSEEEAHHIKCRWPQSSSQYKEVHSSLSKRREKELGEIMWSTSSRRQFLLKLKAKYAGKYFFNEWVGETFKNSMCV